MIGNDSIKSHFRSFTRTSIRGFRSDLAPVIAQFLGSNMISLVITMISGLLAARLAGPDRMGYIVLVSLSTVYSPFLLLASVNGLRRQFPLLMSQGRTGEVIQATGATWAWARLTGLLLLGGMVAFAGWKSAVSGERMLAEALLAYAIIASLKNLDRVLMATYRTGPDFMRLARIKLVVTAVSGASIGLLLIDPWYGLLARGVLVEVVNYSLLRYFIPVKLRPKIDFRQLLAMIKIGVPLFIIGQLYAVLSSMDRTSIAFFIDPEKMGLYAPALQVIIPLSVLTQSITRILYARSCIIYGKTNNSRSLARFTLFPQIILAFTLIPVLGLGLWLVGPFIRAFLPEYVEGITVARWILVAGYFRAISTGALVHTVVRRNLVYGAGIVLSMGVMFLVIVYLVQVRGMGIVAAGIGRTAGMFSFMLFSTLSAIYYIFIKPVRLEGEQTQNGEDVTEV